MYMYMYMYMYMCYNECCELSSIPTHVDVAYIKMYLHCKNEMETHRCIALAVGTCTVYSVQCTVY